MLKDDVAHFSRLYIVAQNRNADIGNFFKHENHPYPPSLSERGKLCQGRKSDLKGILEMQTEGEPPAWIDGDAAVHMLPVVSLTQGFFLYKKAFIQKLK